jgi:RNA polymerase sigma factor (TIGR02999 family)
VEQPGEITALLREWSGGGDKTANADQLFSLVYPHLHTIAAALFRRERSGSILQPTGVVNELFLKLIRQRKLDFEDRQHFYSFSARLMRRILVDYARADGRQKRDGGTLVPFEENLSWVETNPGEMIDLDEALAELEALDPRKCRMVELRMLMGFTAEETAEIMHLSKASVDRDLRFVRGWLALRLRPDGVAAEAADTPDGQRTPTS